MLATRSVASNPIVRYVADALRFYMEFHARYDGFYGAFIHDPLAVAAALDRSLVTTEALYVDVETARRADDRDDRRRPAAADRQAAEPRRRRRRRTSPTFLDRLIERVGGLAAEPRRTCHARRRWRPARASRDGMEAWRWTLDWLQICAEGQTTAASRRSRSPTSSALIVGAVLFAVIARRSRDLTTATLTLMAVAIAINIAVGSITVVLRLPIYLDSIGTVLVGALAGPWAGALTGLLSNLIWSLLPVPGGAGPTTAFFAPVAGVIGLMAGFWASRGVFQLRSDDARVGGFLALAAGIAGGRRRVPRRPADDRHPGLLRRPTRTRSANQTQFVLIALVIVALGVVVGWLTGRTVFAFRATTRGSGRISRRHGHRGLRARLRDRSGSCSARPATSRRSTA